MDVTKSLAERDSLFRAEAVLSKSPRILGAAIIYQPIFLQIAVFLIGILVVITTALVSQISYKSTVPVRGMLNPKTGATSINAPTRAQVNEILVREGQKVEKGDVLARLSSSLLGSNGNEKNDLVIQQLISDQQYLNREQEYAENIFTQSMELQIEKIEDTKINIDLVDTETNLLEAQILLSEGNLSAQQALYQNRSLSQMEFNRHQANHMVLQQRDQDIRIRRNRVKAEYTAAKSEKLLLVLEHDQERLRFEQQSKQLLFRIQQTQDEEKLSVIAPSSGTITAISAQQGQTSDPRQALMYLMPKNDQLEAFLYIPSSLIGKIEPGQRVQINYDSYNFREFGYYDAAITTVSGTSLDPREHLLPISNLQEPVFRVVAQIGQQYVQGDDYFRLRSGMVFDAHVVITEMTMLEYLFKPLLGVKRKI